MGSPTSTSEDDEMLFYLILLLLTVVIVARKVKITFDVQQGQRTGSFSNRSSPV
jgi:hypothetical protein